MSRLREKAELIMKYGDSVIAEKQRKTAVIKRTAYSVSGICAAAGISFSIWNNDAIKNSADFDKYNSSSVVDNHTESSTFTISSESTVETTTSTVADITVNSAETSEITTAEPPHTQETAVSDTTTKKTSAAIRTTAAYTQNTAAITETATVTTTQNTVTITETQLAETVTVITTQTTAKDEPTSVTTTKKINPTTVSSTTKAPPSGGEIEEVTTVGTSVPSIPEGITTEITSTTSENTFLPETVSLPESFTSATTAATGEQSSTTTTTGRNPTTIPALDIITNGAGEFIGISYDSTNYYKVSEEVDTSYLSRDKRKYLGYVYYKGKNYGSLYYVYNYKEQGKPALILGVYNSRSYRLFLMD